MEKLKKLLKIGLARKIVEFFSGNPFSIDSASGIAAWVHADREEVRELLNKMVELEILETDMMGRAQGYSLTRDEKKIKALEKALNL